MIQQAYKYIRLGLWPQLMFVKLKITNTLKSSGWGLERSELPWKHNFYSGRCVSCRTISLPSFNVLRCKLVKIALFIYLMYHRLFLRFLWPLYQNEATCETIHVKMCSAQRFIFLANQGHFDMNDLA